MNPIWAITTFFNPARFYRRLANFHQFRGQLGLPLLAVELTFDGHAPQLRDDDADVVLRCADGDVLWQKERLLNFALQRLPDECRYVAWIDADVVFANRNWAGAARERLQSLAVLQPFSQLHHLARDNAAPGWSQPSFLAALAGGMRMDEIVSMSMTRSAGSPAKGMAWAARRELIERHGFYDRCIVGGGDTAFACAAVNEPNAAIEAHAMNAAQQAAYGSWAAGVAADVRGRAGFIEGELRHLWHGDIADRQSRERHRGLAPFAFDPGTDIAPGNDGAWRWACAKPAMHRYVRDYFASRHEDGRAPAR